MDFSESSEKVLADADFRSFGITRDAVDFRSNITFSSFHLYTVLGNATNVTRRDDLAIFEYHF